MWGTILKSAFGAAFGKLLEAWKHMMQRKEDVQKGADAVKKGQLEHENEILKDALDATKDVHSASDDDLDDGMRKPGS